jgi:hypothetical protein
LPARLVVRWAFAFADSAEKNRLWRIEHPKRGIPDVNYEQIVLYTS